MNTPVISLLRQNPWFWLGLGLVAVAVRGLFLDVMDVDASQYASISMEMLQNGSWLQVMHREADYLDKPPLLFWLSAGSFSVFGLSNWAYKLPSLLAAMAGVYAVYRFCKLFYPEQLAVQAAFILASSTGLLVICNDVRTDTLLLGFTACAVWQFAAYLQGERWQNWFGAFFFVAMAMLAKGPIGLVMPAFAAGCHLLLRGELKNIFRWQWLPGLLLVGLLLLPMCWGLYQQFDLHPEKMVNGRSAVSGLYFYFWEQSFGRITGENVWRNDTSVFYFLHVYAWAFLPWYLLLVGALMERMVQAYYALTNPASVQHRTPENYALGGFVLTFIALSLSKYKLPHYVFVTLPWAAVLAADFMARKHHSKWWVYLQYITYALLMLLTLLILGWVFWCEQVLVWVATLSLWGYLWMKIVRNPFPAQSEILVQRGVMAALATLFVLNFHFYPSLLPYQSTSNVMKRASEMGIPAERIAFFGRHGHALDFYNGDLLEQLSSPEAVFDAAGDPSGLWVYTDEAGRKALDEYGIGYTVTIAAKHFQVALLKPAFLNPQTRNSTLENVFLLKIQANRALYGLHEYKF